MGTHPIFESDFDCLTEMDYLVRTASALTPCLVSGVAWTVLTWVINPSIWRFTPLNKVYESQKSEAKVDLNARLTAMLHATIVFLMSAYLIVFDPEFTWRDVYTYAPMARLCLTLSAGYFLSDMIICTKLKDYYPEATSYMVHHIVSIFGIVLSLRDQGAMWFVCCRLLTELSTPFVNLKFMLMLVGQAKGALYIANEHIAFWCFIISRPLLSPFFWYCTLHHWTNPKFWSMDPALLIFWIVSATGLDILNSLWLKSIIKGYYDEQIKPIVKTIKGKSDRKRG